MDVGIYVHIQFEHCFFSENGYILYKDLCKYMVCVYYYLCYLCKYLFVGIESSILWLFSQSGQTNLILCYVIIT